MIRLDRREFIYCMNAIIADDKERHRCDEFIESLSSSYVVLDPSPANAVLLDVVKKFMNDKEDIIDWYLYENLDKKTIYTNCGEFEIRTLSELYEYLTIFGADPDEDIGYYVAQKVDEIGICDFDNFYDLYMYVCHNIKDVIKNVINSEKIKPDDKQNIIVELKFFEKIIEEDNKKTE